MIHAICFRLQPFVLLASAEEILNLASFAVEGLVGRVQVRTEAQCFTNEASRAIVIDASRPAGLLVALIFAGLLSQQFGNDAFSVAFLHIVTADGEQS